jgi:NTE family protein
VTAVAEGAPAGEKRIINLALQGGGAHGAFTWGVLDRFLEDERIGIEGISGTSAGAINAALLAQGHIKGKAQGARAELDRFWHRLSEIGFLSPVHRGWMERAKGSWNLDGSPMSVWVDEVTRLVSPYTLNPLNLSPLRDLLAQTLDWPALSAPDSIKLYITATNVETGKPRVFARHELTLEALLASTALPQLFQAVVIDGTPYWDGGYMGNPSIWPLVYFCQSHDVVVVQVNPLTRKGVPRSAAEITNRLNEITFNTPLMGEMRAISFVQRLLAGDTGNPELSRLKNMLVHMVGDEQAMEELGVASKLNTDLDFLLYLKGLGRRTAEAWLDRNFAALNNHSSFDIRKVFL